MYIFTIFLITCIIVIISIFNIKKREFFRTNLYETHEYQNIKCKPINMIINNIEKRGDIIDNNIKITPSILEDALDKIKKNKTKYRYNELESTEKIGVCKIKLMIFKLLKKIKYNIEMYLLVNNKKQCNSFNRCQIDFIENYILIIGKYKENTIIEGQLLLCLKDSSFEFAIHYVIDDELSSYKNDNININYLKLMGFDFRTNNINKYNVFGNNLNNNLMDKYVNIYSNTYGNTYNAHNTYYYTSNEEPILLDKIENKEYLNKKEKEKSPNNLFRCYGKEAQNKDLCEALYDRYGNKNKKVGIWDKPCSNNIECPFYKANMNYPNNFGGCKSGKCQMPVGIIQISPRKFIGEENGVCHNCKEGLNCCIEQKNSNKYTNLSSPDYYFENDLSQREKHRDILLKNKLKLI